MEKTFEEACASQEIPNAVLLATDREGKFTYSKTFGSLSLGEGAPAVQVDSPMWIASCTKLITTISCLQCVEKGQLTLDNDLSTLLPEVKDIEIITGYDENDKPTLVQAKNKITLRLLLTHSAGMAYDLFSPPMMKWRKYNGQRIAPGTTIKERYLHPLLYEPGTGWEYSPAIDFAGLCVERATGKKLEEHMTENIFTPLGIKDMTFFVDERPDMKERMPAMTWRDTATGKATQERPTSEGVPAATPTEAMGGGGITASPTEYIKILHAILKNDGTLLKKETVDMMFQPHLTPESKEGFMKLLAIPEFNQMVGNLPQDVSKDWGLGGMLIEGDFPEWRSKGTMSWGGMPNLIWFIDPVAGLCGLYASQILPPGDLKSVEMSTLFEKEMYARYKKDSARL
jgi:CubicO group peptidase (beta-lactamase class C family)